MLDSLALRWVFTAGTASVVVDDRRFVSSTGDATVVIFASESGESSRKVDSRRWVGCVASILFIL